MHEFNLKLGCCCLIAALFGCYDDTATSKQTHSDGDIDALLETLAPPVFSHTSGFYTDDITLAFTHPDPDVTILYTTDGSEPLIENLAGVSYRHKNRYAQDHGQESGELMTRAYTASMYSEPLQISDRCGEPNKLAEMSSTWHYRPDYIPMVPVKKATVVKAKAFGNDSRSPTVTHTYFISSDDAFDTHLPIVSISLNEDALFDYEEGIYVAGKDFDRWRGKNPEEITTGHKPSNYRRTGRDIEKPATFQYFVDGIEVLNQNIGLRLHGAFSKSAQIKSFRLYARKEYDVQNKFRYPFFGDGNSSSFKRLILRNSGNDTGTEWIGRSKIPTRHSAVYFRDAFNQEMVSHLRLDTQDYTPVVTYVNGEYWGLLNVRERYDKHYLERMYGIEEDELDLLEDYSVQVEEGDDTHYQEMLEYISSHSLEKESRYNHVKTLMDVENFTDYNIAEIYIGNTDWPANNNRYFRKRTDEYEPDAPYGQDGRWRWLMFDTDWGFGLLDDDNYKHRSLKRASSGNSESTIILAKLLENETFRNSFINRYADLLNTAFLPERLSSLIDKFADRIAEEMPFHQERWNTLPDWETHVEGMHTFAERRPEYAREHIEKEFDLDGELTAELTVSEPEHGIVRINTIEISSDTPGVADSPYPWTGVYFRDIPITVTAIPNDRYAFSHWSGESDSTDSTISITPTDDFFLQANFEYRGCPMPLGIPVTTHTMPPDKCP